MRELLLICFVFVLLSCSSSQTKRGLGISYAEKGDWDKAIEYLEEYVSQNIDKFPSALSVSEDIVKLENRSDYKDFIEAVFYLLASYLGKAGFNWIDIVSDIIDITEIDPSKKEGKIQTGEIIMDIAYRIYGQGEYFEENLREAIYYLYKARRIAEKVLYSSYEDKNIDLFPNISTPTSEQEWTDYEIGKLVNSVEYLYGKILGWLSLVSSLKLRQIQYYVEREEGKNPPPPSYCCLFEGWNKGQGVFPYNITSKDIGGILKDVFSSMIKISYGTYAENIRTEYSEFATRYSEIQEDLFGELEEKIERSCKKWSEEFFKFIKHIFDEGMEKILEEFPDILTYSLNADVKEEGGIWLCPSRELLQNFRYDIQCSYSSELTGIYEKYKSEIFESSFPGYSDEVTFQVVFKISSEEGLYEDCNKNKIEGPRITKPITIVITIKPHLGVNEAENLISDICLSESFKEFDISNVSNIVEREIEGKAKKALREIFKGRGEPEICSLGG